MKQIRYIDADKLIAEIEQRIARLNKELKPAAEEDFVSSWASTAKNKRVALQSILSFITSLQQEQPTRGYDEAYLNECIAKARKTWKGVDVDKYMDEMREREHAQPEVDLERELCEYYNKAEFGPSDAIEYETHKEIAHYFWNMGYNAIKEETK